MRINFISGRRGGLAAMAAALLAVACHGSVTDTSLRVINPTVIDPGVLNNADGANALRTGALARLRSMTGGGTLPAAGGISGTTESSWLFGGLLGDEWQTSSTFIQNDEADERRISLDNGTVTTQFRTINQVRTSSNQAIAALKAYRPTASTDIAEMYFARGFAELQLAQDFCNGIPLSDASVSPIVYGKPQTTDAVFRVAMASLDTAITLSGTGTDAQSLLVNRAARVARARAQLGINDIAGAATTVAAVPSIFSYDVSFALSSGDNVLWAQPFSSNRYSLGDTSVTTSAGTFITKPNLNFASAGDPRVPAQNPNKKGQDGSVFVKVTTLWGQSTNVSVMNGIDARLIEAEAFLKAGNTTSWLATLNTLRTQPPQPLGAITVTAMAPLADPGDAASRLALTFREKAFWTFGRGQRLSDMRRLIRQYGLAEANVFPTGTHYRGVPYGTDKNLPVPQDETNNPNFTGCIDRNP
jgi:hypothetical protein